MIAQTNGGIMRMAKLDYKYGAGEYLKSMNLSAKKYKLFASSNSNSVSSSNSNSVSLNPMSLMSVGSYNSYGSDLIPMSLISLNSVSYDSLVNSFASNSSHDYSRKSDAYSTNSNVDKNGKIKMMQDIIAKFQEKKRLVVKSESVSGLTTLEGSASTLSNSASPEQSGSITLKGSTSLTNTGQLLSNTSEQSLTESTSNAVSEQSKGTSNADQSGSKTSEQSKGTTSQSDAQSGSEKNLSLSAKSASKSPYFSIKNMRSEFTGVRNAENDIIGDFSPTKARFINSSENKVRILSLTSEETTKNSQSLNEELFSCLTKTNSSSENKDKIDITKYKYIVEIIFDNKSAIPKRIKMFKKETYSNNPNNSYSIRDFLVGYIKNKKRGTNFSENNQTTTMAFYYNGIEKNAECLLFEVPIKSN